MNRTDFEGMEVNDMMEDLIQKINKAVRKKRAKIIKNKIGESKWWEKECTERKGEIRKSLRKWQKIKGSQEEYMGKKKAYKMRCEKMGKDLQVTQENEIQLLTIINTVRRYIAQKG